MYPWDMFVYEICQWYDKNRLYTNQLYPDCKIRDVQGELLWYNIVYGMLIV